MMLISIDSIIPSETEILDCPVSYVQKIISGKWNIIIIYFLNCGTMRFDGLQRILSTVTQAVSVGYGKIKNKKLLGDRLWKNY